MITKKIPLLCIFSLLIILSSCSRPKNKFETWLSQTDKNKRPLDLMNFAEHPLSKKQSAKALELLLSNKQASMLDDYGDQWDNRQLKYHEYVMPFYYQVFGDKPCDGRSLFISLHGGGGAPTEVNDQQYENQKHLYDACMDTLEGVYLAPRAPGNTWDLWHQDHIDDFLNIIIQLAVIKEDVNPNKVYLLGYSAGGDGLYQLAPRMADRWAAASMMAGHPNDASPLGLRNTPFAIYVGADDHYYNRNIIAQEWDNTLDSLQDDDPQGYVHDVHVLSGFAHWMHLKDATALAWMKNYQRNPIPDRIVWKQDNRHHSSFYWLKVPKKHIATGKTVIAEYKPLLNEINIIKNDYDTVEILVNDEMLNLDKPITIKHQKQIIYQGIFKRSIESIYNSLSIKGDFNLAFPSIITIVQNSVIII